MSMRRTIDVFMVGMLVAGAEKTLYRIGGWLPATGPAIRNKLRPLYEDYLNDYFRREYNGSATFEFIPVDYSKESYSDSMMSAKTLDFLHSIPGRTVCVEAEFGWVPVVTQRGRVHGLDTGAQGTVLFSMKSNTKIQNISDFKGKRLGIGYLLASNSYHFGYQLLLQNGINIFTDMSMLVFYGFEYQAMLDDVTKEKLDGGILTSTWLADNNYDIFMNKLLVHNDKKYTYEGEVFPFPTSTQLSPAYGLVASPDVPWRLKAQISDALTNITYAHPAASGAGISTFTVPGHFANVRGGLDDMSLMHQPTLASWTNGNVNAHCDTPYDDIIDTITCPEGFVLQDEETIVHKCAKDGMVCPAGRPCLCYPCQRDLKVRVFPARVVLGLVVALFTCTLMLSVCWVIPLEAAPFALYVARRVDRAARRLFARASRASGHRHHHHAPKY